MKTTILDGNKLSSSQKEQLYHLLVSREGDFIPPISERGEKSKEENIKEYFEHLLSMRMVLIEENVTMSNIPDEVREKEMHLAAYLAFEPEHYFPPTDETILYMSSAIVDPKYRGHHYLEEMYKCCFEEAGDRPVGTRTWSTNGVQLHLLPKLGFEVAERIVNDRGEGIDSLYYIRHIKK